MKNIYLENLVRNNFAGFAGREITGFELKKNICVLLELNSHGVFVA